MNILVTGGAGFIGHHFVNHLLVNTDWHITVLDSLTYAGDPERLTDIECFDPKRVKIIWHDLRAAITLEKAKKIDRLDYIVHFAAETHVDRSLQNPILFVQTNVLGTMNLLEYARHTSPRVYVQVSTDEVYGPADDGVFYKEWDRLKPSNPYAASKAGADCMVLSYARSYGLPAVITRTMNNFGERQHPEKFVPMCIRSILDEEIVPIHAEKTENGWESGSRCWLHARNHADAILFLLKNYNENMKGDIFNVVGGEFTNLQIAKMIAKFLGKPLLYGFEDFHSARPGHDRRYALDGKKLYDMGWFPPFTLEESLKKTVLWMEKNRRWLE